MIVALDNTFLSLVFNPSCMPTPNPATRQPVSHCKNRVEAMIDRHSDNGDKVIIPSPCLTEMLCAVPDFERVISEIGDAGAFEIAPFDERCAIDLAEHVRGQMAVGMKSRPDVGWKEVKYDRQIAMIAKVNGAQTLYTDDDNQTKFAWAIGLTAVHTWDLPLPPKYAQMEIWNAISQE